MRLTSVACALVLTLGGAALAQQPNTADASLLINNLGGPPWPVQNATVYTGLTTTMDLHGQPATPYLVATAPSLSAGSWTTPYGIVDLPLAQLTYLPNNGDILDGFGDKNFVFAIPQNLSTSITAAYQAAVYDVTAPLGASLTAATSIQVVQGLVTGSLSIGDDSSQSINLSPYNLRAAYYANRYATLYVNCNGSVSYNGANTDFTATAGEFRSAQARCAMFWADLNTAAAGASVTWQIDFSQGIPLFTLNFDNVGESYGPTTRHWFSMDQQLHVTGEPFPLGDIILHHPANNPQSNYDTVVGLSPGGNLSSAQPQDLSMVQDSGGYLGAANEAIYEFFRGQTSTVTPPGAAPLYDLQTRDLTFQAINAGNSGAQYFYY